MSLELNLMSFILFTIGMILGWSKGRYDYKPKAVVPRQKRICQLCGKQIKRAHRFTHAINGKPEHLSCENPQESPGGLIADLKRIPTDEQQTLPLEGE